jgi:hypothetical protein
MRKKFFLGTIFPVFAAILFSMPASGMPLSDGSMGADLGIYGSWGSMKDTNSTISSVHTSTMGAYLLPRFGLLPGFSIGAYGEYDKVGQLTSPNSVGGSNEACSGYLAGPAVVFKIPFVRVTFAYTLLGSSTLDKKTSSGLSTSLEKPKGMHGILSLGLLPLLSLDLAYASVKYTVNSNGAASSDIRTWRDYRLGGSLHF